MCPGQSNGGSDRAGPAHSLVVMEGVFGSKIGADSWRVLGPFADDAGFAVKADLGREESAS